MPLSVLEAMAAKVAIIATNVGGIPEVVSDEREALLVGPSDPDALANAISRLVADPPLLRKLGAAAQQRAQRDFSFERMLDKYDDLYRSVS